MTRQPRFQLKRWAEAQIDSGARWSGLAGDGSDKLFWRLTWPSKTLVAVDGGLLEPARQAENQAFAGIGGHLAAQGVPVPRILARDVGAGFFIIEDLGDEHLYDRAREAGPSQRSALYRKVIEELISMQVKGAQGFRTSWCAQTGRYDQKMILTHETAYFMRAFAHDYCGAEEEPRLGEELTRLAGRAADSGPELFLHRDFQSRNIMIFKGKIRTIDYQGGRLGPPGYDLASLLLDPYVGLSPKEQEGLLEYYLARAGEVPGIEGDSFRRDYKYLALHRLMQMLGAFSFLSQVKERPGFEEHIPLALTRLNQLLSDPEFDKYPVFRGFAQTLGEGRG